MNWIWTIIVGGLIGLIAGAITRRGGSMGWIANIIAGLLESILGEDIFGTWGPSMAGMSLVPSVIGAVILVMIVSVVLGITKDRNRA